MREANLDADLDALADDEAANPAATFWLDPPGINCWGMADWQRAVVEDPSDRVFVRKGNKVGGSAILAWTARAFFGGFHPSPHWRRPRRQTTLLYVAATLDTSYRRDVSARLREFFTDADLSARCRFDRVKGFMVGGGRGIETRGGDQIVFGSGTQDALAISGMSVDGVLVNEPPREHIWGEIIRTAAEFSAPALVNFTPLPPESLVGADDLVWFREEMEKPDGRWSEHVVPLTYENAPYRTRLSIDKQIADMRTWERPQRRDAAWEGPAPARTIGNWTDAEGWSGDSWADLPGLLPGEDLRLGLWADHGELGGHEVVLLGAWQGRGRTGRVWFVDEYVSPDRTTIRQDAGAILRMLGARGLRLDQIDEGVGDVNSTGKSAKTSINEELSRELREQAGCAGPRFESADKGPGSVSHGVHVLDDGLGEGRVLVHARCVGLRRAFRRWEGDDDEFKHWIDAARYGAVPHMDPRRSDAPRRIARG